VALLLTEGDELVVYLAPWERVGRRSCVRVARENVRHTELAVRPLAALRGLRFGIVIPGVFVAATLVRRSGRDFAVVYRGRPAVIVHLENERYERLIISQPDLVTTGAPALDPALAPAPA